ncbi:unnamed protein product [Ceutorhynchus assimilis]|uniref:NADH dehydrogenase [ubiquinone] 1 alpha subcomplex subunit 7 n=1 Tax=Ceutorhynchus assimilis TaxID=467358 RepID=A0A9P0DGW2_9CUCU|nr:unnamed protein product [Ceutorhynchus assimilis]
MPPRPTIPVHDVNPFFQKLREFLLGRKHTLALRFPEYLATRSPPPPSLPDGVTHKLSANYYYTRDGRREAVPPEVIASGLGQIEAGTEASVRTKRITPGKPYKWD